MKTILISLTLIAVSHGVDIEGFAGITTTLKTLHVIFRHGDRTPDNLYPKDPYNENSFYPISLGHLTNNGKRTAFNIGTALRKKYGRFLPNIFTPEILYTISSHFPRCQSSLQLVLAGLFPSTDLLRWNNNLPWEPIPYEYLRKSENKLFSPPYACPLYYTRLEEAMTNSSSDVTYLKHRHLEVFLQESAGFEESHLFHYAYQLYSTLKAEEEYGLVLPKWTHSVYPDILDELHSVTLEYYAGVGDMKILQAGLLFSKIINNTLSVIQAEETAKNRKIHLYSGHDTNIIGMLFLLEHYNPVYINYGAFIVVEVHQFLGINFLKFLYQNYQYREPETIIVPNCGVYCPLNVFKQLYSREIDPILLDSLCG